MLKTPAQKRAVTQRVNELIRDDHHQAAANACKPHDGSRGRRAAPFLIHFMGCINSQLKKGSMRIN